MYEEEIDMKIIYGTTNKNKIKEMQTYFNDYNMELISLKDIDFNDEIVEDGETFLENSLIKAKKIKDFCNQKGLNYPILTDDAGLCVEALNNRPGVHTARYAGDHAPQIDNINKMLFELKDETNRNATFFCALTFVYHDEFIQVEGFKKGNIALEAGTLGGFTFGPLFIPEGFDKPYNDLVHFETHRHDAINRLIKVLKEKKIID